MTMISLVEIICEKYACLFTRDEIQALPRDIWPQLRKYMDFDLQIINMHSYVSTLGVMGEIYYNVYAENWMDEQTDDVWPLIRIDGDIYWDVVTNKYELWAGVSDRMKIKRHNNNTFIVKLRRLQITRNPWKCDDKVMMYESSYDGQVKISEFITECDKLFDYCIPRPQNK